jgi:predicted glutamine amidotransferase
MCRIAAYFGSPVRLSSLLHEPPHGLTDQSRNARQMTDSSIAGDGWGVGWFHPEAGPTPGMIKSILPLWSDENAKTATHAILSGTVVGHVRYASPNIEVCFTNMPLYVLDDHLWTINGELQP